MRMPLRLPPERPFSIMGSRLPPPPARPRRQGGGGKSKEASDVAKEQSWGWLCMRAPGEVRAAQDGSAYQERLGGWTRLARVQRASLLPFHLPAATSLPGAGPARGSGS